MKLTSSHLIAVLALSGWVGQAVAAETQASNSPAPAAAAPAFTTNPAARPARPPGGPADLWLQRLKIQLTLTEAQEPKVKAALETFFKQQMELRQATQEARREKFPLLTAELEKQLKEVLTSEQFEKWKAVGIRARRPQGSPGGPGAPPQTVPPVAPKPTNSAP